MKINRNNIHGYEISVDEKYIRLLIHENFDILQGELINLQG